MSYETSRKINDWRYRSEADKIITLFFSCDHISGTPSPQDDIAELDWIKLTDLPQLVADGLTSDEHLELFNLIIKKYLNN